MKKYLFSTLIVALLVGTVSCSPSTKEHAKKTSSLSQKENLEEDKSLFGTYKGTFPCADCGGKDISLTISSDGTYSLNYTYQDKDERFIEENGTYSILDDTLIETVTPSSGTKTYYKYVHGNLVLSDSLGTIDNSKLAELYVLKRELEL